MPGDPVPDRLPHGKRLLNLEGISVGKLTRVAGAPDDLAVVERILILRFDPQTGRELTSFTNPLDGKTRPAMPVLLEYVANRFRVANGRLHPVKRTGDGPRDLPRPERAGGLIGWSLETALNQDLKKSFGIDDTFDLRGGRLVQTAVLHTTIDTHALSRAPRGGDVLPAQHTRTFVQPFPPFMCLPDKDTPGQAMYHYRMRVVDSIGEASDAVRAALATRFPQYAEPPQRFEADRASDNRWSAFYRSQLQPQGLTWRQWCERTAH